MDRCKWILSYLPSLGLMCVYASLFFGYSPFTQIALITTGVGYAIDYAVNQRWRTWSFSKEKWTYVASMVYYLLLPIWILLGIDTGPDTTSFYERLMPFGIVGLIGLMGISRQIKVEWMALVGLTVVSVVTVLIVSHIGISSMFTLMHDDASPFNQARLIYSESHMQFNMYANMALILGFATIVEKKSSLVWRIIIGLEMLITMSAVLVSEGRAGLVSMLIIVILMVIYLLWSYKKWMSIVLGSLAIIGSCVILNYSLKAHYSQLENEPRLYIWQVAVHQFEQHPWIGYGMSRGHEEFIEMGVQDQGFVEHFYNHFARRSDIQIDEFHYHGVHPHNAFLEAGIAYGILGILLLAFIFFSPIFLQPYPNNRYTSLVAIVFLIQAMFEHMGHDLNPLLFMLMLLVLSPKLADCQSDSK